MEMVSRLIISGIVSVSLLTVSSVGPVHAADMIDQLVACKAIKKDKRRLRCLDEAIADLGADSIVRESADGVEWSDLDQDARAAVEVDASPPSADDLFGSEDLSAVKRKKREEKPKSLQAIVVEIARNAQGRYVIVLENGQVWRQLKADNARLLVPKDLQNSPATIRRRSFGSFLFSFNANNRAVKVERLK